MSIKTNCLIIGGSSGLGLELAQLLQSQYKVIITGRTNPNKENLEFIHLDLTPEDKLANTLDKFVKKLPQIDLLIYAAGYYQEGTIDKLTDTEIIDMTNVGLLAPAMLLQRILKKQAKLPGFMAITSTSQWTPRRLEPMYNAVKGGLGMLTNSIGLDERVTKTLLAGPAGMKTPFWKDTVHDTSTMLDPQWVAEQIVNHYSQDFKYKFIKIMRQPARVEVVETR